jgi:excisionase family DNA binding protein
VVVAAPRLMDSREVAERFGVSLESARRWARLGRVRAVRTPGGVLRFDAAEIERLARLEREAGPPA